MSSFALVDEVMLSYNCCDSALKNFLRSCKCHFALGTGIWPSYNCDGRRDKPCFIFTKGRFGFFLDRRFLAVWLLESSFLVITMLLKAPFYESRTKIILGFSELTSISLTGLDLKGHFSTKFRFSKNDVHARKTDWSHFITVNRDGFILEFAISLIQSSGNSTKDFWLINPMLRSHSIEE